MKAVNQSIGRAVRHKDDYASVVLLDQRYLQHNRQKSLPQWIQRSLESHERFGSAFASLRKVCLGKFSNGKNLVLASYIVIFSVLSGKAGLSVI